MKTALILIDIQNDYFENGNNPLSCSLEASLNAKMLLNYFRNKKLPIVHIQHIAVSPVATFFKPNTLGAEIHLNVFPKENEKVIQKYYPNAFRETELLEYLKTENITDLVICGMMTQMCVDATVRAAKDFGFNIKVIGDACATKNLEINGNTVKADDVQRSFLAALNYFYSEVINTEEFLKA